MMMVRLLSSGARRAWLLSCLALAASAALGRGLTPADVARIQSVASAEISPDGKHIAYLLSVPRLPGQGEDGPAYRELHVVDPQTGKSRPFLTGKVTVSQVQWSADSRYIYFAAKLGDDKHRRVHRIAIDGGGPQPVTDHKTAIDGFAVAPDGSRIAFLATEKDDESSEKLREKGFKQQIYEEDFDRARLWFAELGDRPAKGEPVELDGSVSAVKWSPAGDKLAIMQSKTPLIDDVMMFSRVKLLSAESGAVTAEVETAGKLGDFAFSPDGKQLAVITSADIHDPSEGRLSVVPVAGGKPVDLRPGYLGHVVSIGWQTPDTIMYVGHEGVYSTFNKVPASGGESKTLVPAGGPILYTLSMADDGQSGVFVADAPTHPREVFYMKHGDANPRRLTDSNPWLSEITLGKQEVIRHAARDGLELEGILIHALDVPAGQRTPMVLCVHGGPEAHETNGWLTNYADPGQMLAAKGIAVFYPNYRGSTGRGVAFSMMGQHDYGGKEFDDLVDAVDHLVKAGLVDDKKVGVTGGSYGGYATGWLGTRYSERFAAGVMFVGLGDQLMQYGTTDIPQEKYLVHARVWPWEQNGWQFLLERSPIYHAEKARTPLLILHGKDDPRVSYNQSLALYRYLKLHGKAPVRLVLYPSEGHGNQKAAARYDYSLRMMNWFEHYLLGDGGAMPDNEMEYDLDQFKEEKPEEPEVAAHGDE